MELTPWTLLVDAGLIGLLLAVGVGLRAWIRPLRELMVPASMIAGFLGLGLGPEGLDLLPFSPLIADYPSVLIVVVFACLAMTMDFKLRGFGGSVGEILGYSVFMYSAQIAVGVLAVLVLLGPLFGVPDAFGTVLFAGFAGGFGTAAAIGQVFGEAGYEEIQALAFTSATVGLLVGIVGGIIMARIGMMRGHTRRRSGQRGIPEDEKSGVLTGDVDERPRIGTHLFSGSSVDSLAFQIGIVTAIAAGAYGVQIWLEGFMPDIVAPVFSLAFLVGLALHLLLRKAGLGQIIDKDSMQSISGTATDLLIVCGIASIVPALVADYLVPLVILFAVGLVLLVGAGVFLAPRVLSGAWFEKQLFTWGWSTGAVAQGIALLRIVDPKLESRVLEEYALQAVVNHDTLVAVTFVPTLILAGLAWAVVGIWGALAVAGLVLAFLCARVVGRRTAAV